MSFSDRQDWLQEIMALIDAVDEQEKSAERAEMSEQAEDRQTIVEEDFVSNSR
jgi:hypothetical protein